MHRFRGHLGAAMAAAVLAACGSDSTTSTPSASTTHGTLAVNPPFRIASVDAATLAAQLGSTSAGAGLLELAGTPTCGVDVYYLNFWTVGAVGESTESSGALMVPTGAAGTCSGPRPIVLYAHGTQTNKAYNIANITDPTNTEGALVAAMFAAQGYIVVAPNYAGYDISTLGYHPFVNAVQQSGEMIDVLAAARTALPNTFANATSDSGVLFITGYSEGGHVAMATQRALEAAGTPIKAVAPMSGPYALEAFVDAVFLGDVDIDSTIFAPLLIDSYQHAYGDIYSAPTDIYNPTYANQGVATLLPSTTPIATIIESGQLPESALFDSTTPVVSIPNQTALSDELTAALAIPTVNPADPITAIWAGGFGSSYLLTNSMRVAYAEDAFSDPDGVTAGTSASPAAAVPVYPLRKGFYTNDLRNGSWAPTSPTLLCGGENDPTVYFFNTLTMQAFWSGPAGAALSVLDVDPAAGPSGTFAQVQGAFQASQAQQLAYLQTAAGGGLTLAQAELTLAENYHVSVAPFCALAARSFFEVVAATP